MTIEITDRMVDAAVAHLREWKFCERREPPIYRSAARGMLEAALKAPTPEPTEHPLEARVLKLESDLDWLKGHVKGADDSLGNRLDAVDRDLNALSERIETHTYPLDTGTLHRTKTLAPYPVEEPAQTADDGGVDALWEQVARVSWRAEKNASYEDALLEWDNLSQYSRDAQIAGDKAAVAKAIELGLAQWPEGRKTP